MKSYFGGEKKCFVVVKSYFGRSQGYFFVTFRYNSATPGVSSLIWKVLGADGDLLFFGWLFVGALFFIGLWSALLALCFFIALLSDLLAIYLLQLCCLICWQSAFL